MASFSFKNTLALYQIIAGLVAVSLILIGCIVILQPFFPAALLALLLTLATWPAFIWLRSRLNHNTGRAAMMMTVLLSLCFLAPLLIIGSSVADNYDRIYATVQTSLKADPVTTAARLQTMPYAGPLLAKTWSVLASDREALSAALQKYSGPTTEALLKLGKTLGTGIFDVTLGIVLSFFLFRHGTTVATRVGTLIDTFGGVHGRRLLELCKNTLIGVVYGVLGAGLAQGAFAALGFWVADIPGATFLGLLTFFVSVIPFGPPLIWVPCALWLFSEGQTGWAIFLGLWGVFVISMIDNFLKPYFISRGCDMPLLLVLFGIMGGVVAFGFIGLFIGPTLLALAYSLLLEWSTLRKELEKPVIVESQEV